MCIVISSDESASQDYIKAIDKFISGILSENVD